MGKLSDEEKATLDALTAKSQATDDDDNDEVEWWEEDDKGNRRGGRVPWSKGKQIYGKHFPDLFGDKPPAGEKGKEGGAGKEGDGKGGESGGTAGKYFGKS